MKRNNTFPRVLVISNNPFSDTTNNGKTLASFFDKFPKKNIAQLYFIPEKPDNNHYLNYYRITDNDVLRCVFRKDTACGSPLYYQNASEKDRCQKRNNRTIIIDKLKKYNLVRLTREILWKSKKWKTELLIEWLEKFSPEVIFFCAGDSGFAYDITNYIQKKYNTKLVVYITDDYILPRRTFSLFWWLRRNYILKKMRHSIDKCDLFITISEKMQKEYKTIFGKDSILAVNMTESMKDKSITSNIRNYFTLVYAGGLHYKRYETLSLLANALKKYNSNIESKQKAYLKIYSRQEPNEKILKYLNIDGASKFYGKLNQKQLREVLNSCDILVHVESFDKKCIESTRLSISTKIPEYLSLEKPVLAIGPSQVASMEYLSDSAFCITNPDEIYFKVGRLLNDIQLRTILSQKALQKYEDNHKKEIISDQFIFAINDVWRNGLNSKEI